MKRPSRGYIPQVCAASIEEINENANNEEMEENDDQGSYSEGYQDNYDHESYQESPMDDVPSLAAHTAKLNEGQRETWLEEMRQLSINFQGRDQGGEGSKKPTPWASATITKAKKGPSKEGEEQEREQGRSIMVAKQKETQALTPS